MGEHDPKLVLTGLGEQVIDVAVEIVDCLVDIEEGGTAFGFGECGTLQGGLQGQRNEQPPKE